MAMRISLCVAVCISCASFETWIAVGSPLLALELLEVFASGAAVAVVGGGAIRSSADGAGAETAAVAVELGAGTGLSVFATTAASAGPKLGALGNAAGASLELFGFADDCPLPAGALLCSSA
jgi:hypothetical protein